MNARNPFVLCLLALFLCAGCAGTKTTRHERLYAGQLPRPTHIWVYDFAATPADLPPGSTLSGLFSQDAGSQSAEQIATGRRLGAQIATELVNQIQKMKMPGAHGTTQAKPGLNDLILLGAVLSFDEGDATKRVTIGLGSGSSELRAAMETFQVTPQGLRKLGGGTGESGGGKTPGAAVGAAAMLATSNPLGLIVSTGVKAYGETSGSGKVEGRAEQMAKEIAARLKERFQEQGWIK
jgi:hypothetical protein